MMRIFAAVIFALWAAAAQAQTLSPAEFTAEIATALRSELAKSNVEIKAELELMIKAEDGRESKAFLHNAYSEYMLASESQRPDIIRKYVAAFAEQQRLWPANVDRSRIVPVIKDRAWFAEMEATLKARGAGPPPEYVSEDFNDELMIFYAEDTPSNIRYLVSKRLEEVGVAREGLRALAIANLAKLLPQIEVHSNPLVSMITAGGDYEASLLLVDDIWSKGRVPETVDGDIVAAIPARGRLFFTGSRNRAGIARLRELARKLVATPYHLTDTLFVYRGGQFTRFDTD
jgi:uncharacterized protein YtpQ (UPF0354 family)